MAEGLLFAVKIVGGEILRDLSADEAAAPRIRFFQPQAFYYRQPPVPAHAAAHVQLAVRAQGQFGARIVDGTAHIERAVAADRDGAAHAVAHDGNGELVRFVFHAARHEGGDRKHPAERRRRKRREPMYVYRVVDEVGRIHHAERHLPAVYQSFDKSVHLYSALRGAAVGRAALFRFFVLRRRHVGELHFLAVHQSRIAVVFI